MSAAVADPYGVAVDTAMPTLGRAIDPEALQQLLDRGVDRLGPAGSIALTGIRVVRYKPGRRCLIEYDLTVGSRTLTAIGKVRRNRPGHHQHRLLAAFWDAGFDDGAPDGIRVPQPLGHIPDLALWFQRRVQGSAATDVLAGPGGPGVGARMAEAAHKIHEAGIPTRKTHTIDDELRILTECLATVADARPELGSSLERLARESVRAARRVSPLPPTGIHRDYYADQVIVDGEALTVVDFDLYTTGDPALDVGNLVGHVTEQSLREHGDPDALTAVEHAAGERFVSLAGEPARAPLDLYTGLTVARHVFLAHERPERTHLVEPLVDIARARVAAVSG